MMNVRRLLATAERAARQAASSTAGAASEAAVRSLCVNPLAPPVALLSPPFA